MFKIVGAQADLLHDTDLLTKMDPYLVLMNSSQRRQSAVKGSAGKHPQWQDTFDFPITGDHILRVQVWDKDTFTPDDLIGEG
jgi:Ca2+-dependent lipid-binding protein